MAGELVSYESAFGKVELSEQTVVDYLVKGNGSVTNQEVKLFIEMCKAQKINPFVTGEVHLIKYGQQPAQMVIGYDTYKRRAEDNPMFLFFESGITVLRGDTVIQKEGACLYPTEVLIGGWCKVHKMRNDREVVVFKEVSLEEYDLKQSIWKTKPCTMIEKVAISQALRTAFPHDYEGLYTAEELAPADYYESDNQPVVEVEDATPITQEDRKKLFAYAVEKFGSADANNIIKSVIGNYGLETTNGMPKAIYDKVMADLENAVPYTASEPVNETPSAPSSDADFEEID